MTIRIEGAKEYVSIDRFNENWENFAPKNHQLEINSADFHRELQNILSGGRKVDTLKLASFVSLLPKGFKHHLIAHAVSEFRDGRINNAIIIFDELGMKDVAAYYRSIALDRNVNSANNGISLYLYHSRKGRKGLAMNYLLIAARKSDTPDKLLLMRKIVSEIDDSNWGKYYKQKVVKELQIAEAENDNKRFAKS